jgi:hypothetical protein
VTKEQHKRMRELQRKDSLSRTEHKELDKLEKEWDEILDEDDPPDDKPTDKPEDEPEDKPEDKPEDEPEDEPEDKPEDKPEDEPEDKLEDKPEDEPEDKPDPPKKAKIKPQNDHWYFRDRGPFRKKKAKS